MPVQSRAALILISVINLVSSELFQMSHFPYWLSMDTNSPAGLESHTSVSVMQCAFICLKRERCIVTMFNKTNNKCSLLWKYPSGLQHKDLEESNGPTDVVISLLLNPCSAKPCLGEGECIGKEHSLEFKCKCRYNLTGQFCENEVTGDSCLHIHAVYNTNFSGTYKLQAAEGNGELTQAYCDMNKIDSSERSCYAIKMKYPTAKSGLYKIYSSTTMTAKMTVYCDMDTDKGGWTQVMRIKSNTSDFSSFESSAPRTVGGISSSCLDGFEPAGNYYLNHFGMYYIHSVTDSQEIRFYCRSKQLNTSFHIKTLRGSKNGTIIAQRYSMVNNPLVDVCGAFTSLSGDSSNFIEKCTELITATTIYSPFYFNGYAAFWNTAYPKFACFDKVGLSDSVMFMPKNVIFDGDLWEVYIR
ncbi:uncharacterized protein LOC135696509 [Rhopilema esculentum]|uniref:uncharacterized protein LOC135696509 n=1 Tax=Rhopilema esculentum TaxID=499914 RepID=UPI0031D9D3F5